MPEENDLSAAELIQRYRRKRRENGFSDMPTKKLLEDFEQFRTVIILGAHDPSARDGFDGRFVEGVRRIDERLKKLYSSELNKLLSRLEKKYD